MLTPPDYTPHPAPAADALVQDCRAYVRLTVRVVDRYLARGVAGVTLRLTGHGGAAVDRLTDAHGRAVFRFRTQDVPQPRTVRLAATMPAGGQYAVEPPEDPDEAVPDHFDVTLQPEQNVEVTLRLVDHFVTAPPDLAARVTNALRNGDLRVYVSNGANFGNQAASVDLLRAIARLVAGADLQGGERPTVGVLAQSHVEYADANYTLNLRLPDAAVANEQRLTALGAALAHALVPPAGAAPIAVEAADGAEGYRITGSGRTYRITVNREQRAGAHDEFSLAHLDAALQGLLAHASATALGLTGVRVQGDEGARNVGAQQGATHQVTLQCRYFGEQTPAQRLDRLAPALDLFYERAARVPNTAGFAATERANRLGLLAAADIGSLHMPATAQEITKWAGELGAADVLVLQPFHWPREGDRRAFRRADAVLRDLRMPRQATFCYTVPPALPATWVPHAGNARLQAFLAAALDAREHGLRWMVGYGLHQAVAPGTVGANLVAALDRLPTRTLLFVPCHNPAFRQGVAAVAAANHTVVIDLDPDADHAAALDAALAQPTTKVIVATTTRSVPNRAFVQMMLLSQRPVLYEGANTANFLYNQGLPHLQVKTAGTPYAKLPAGDGHARLKALTELVVKDGPSGAEIGRLSGFLGDALAGTSEVGAYFTDVRAHLNNDQLDQLKLALYRMDHARNPPAAAAAPAAAAEVDGPALA